MILADFQSDPGMIRAIMEAVSIPVMAKVRIGHTVEAQILQSVGVDYIDVSLIRRRVELGSDVRNPRSSLWPMTSTTLVNTTSRSPSFVDVRTSVRL